jgi:hypothetical protein
MLPKRPKLTHYRIAGRDEPVVHVVDHRHSTTSFSKTSRGGKKGKRQPATFRVEGSLPCDSNNSPQPSNGDSQPSMNDIPSHPSPFSDEFQDIFDSPVGPEDSPYDAGPDPSKKVRMVSYLKFDAELTMCLYARRQQTIG